MNTMSATRQSIRTASHLVCLVWGRLRVLVVGWEAPVKVVGINPNGQKMVIWNFAQNTKSSFVILSVGIYCANTCWSCLRHSWPSSVCWPAQGSATQIWQLRINRAATRLGCFKYEMNGSWTGRISTWLEPQRLGWWRCPWSSPWKSLWRM